MVLLYRVNGLQKEQMEQNIGSDKRPFYIASEILLWAVASDEVFLSSFR